jgi:hypothetical protein
MLSSLRPWSSNRVAPATTKDDKPATLRQQLVESERRRVQAEQRVEHLEREMERMTRHVQLTHQEMDQLTEGHVQFVRRQDQLAQDLYSQISYLKRTETQAKKDRAYVADQMLALQGSMQTTGNLLTSEILLQLSSSNGKSINQPRPFEPEPERKPIASSHIAESIGLVTNEARIIHTLALQLCSTVTKTTTNWTNATLTSDDESDTESEAPIVPSWAAYDNRPTFEVSDTIQNGRPSV